MSLSNEELGELALLEGLSEEELDWFRAHAKKVSLAQGEHMFERGEAADAMWIVVRGLIQGFEEHGGQWLLVATTAPGQVTGMLPFSRMTHYPRHTVAAEPSEVLRIGVDSFPELLAASPEVGRRLVAEMSDRVRNDVRLEQQNEKMMALGKLSAGLAHELNNPASAVRRASVRLSERRDRLARQAMTLVGHDLTPEALQALIGLRAQTLEGAEPSESTLVRSEREDELSAWLEAHGVVDAWEVASIFAESAVTVAHLEEVKETVSVAALPDALVWLAGGLESDRIVAEIAVASARITELIASIKIYSHMDRSTEHGPTDVRVGIDNTLTMLQHKIKSKSLRVERDFQDDLPLIPAHAGELNQVWTNLIDNAIDVMEDGGRLLLRARTNDLWVEVEVVDDGPGIPDEIRARIFEPFFTTKDVGVGTGLGLGIADRIVKTHQGHIEVRSRPGETVMCVRLPLSPVSPVES
jgi:signal transduction histidine kinase